MLELRLQNEPGKKSFWGCELSFRGARKAVVQVAAGTYVMGYLLAEITSLILAAHERGRQSSLRTAALEDFFDAQEYMPAWLQRRIIEYYDKKWHSKEIEVLGEEIAENMPSALKLELSVGWWTAKVKPSVLLPHDHSFLRALLAHAKEYDLKPMQTILEQGSNRGTGHLYVVLSGVVACVQLPDEQCKGQHTEPTPRPPLERVASSGMTLRSSLTLSMLPINLETDLSDEGVVGSSQGAEDELFGSNYDLPRPSVGQASGLGLPPISEHLEAKKGAVTDSEVASSSFWFSDARTSKRQGIGGVMPEDISGAPTHNNVLFPGTAEVMGTSDGSLSSGANGWLRARRAVLGGQLVQSPGAVGLGASQAEEAASSKGISGGKSDGTVAVERRPETNVSAWELAEGSVLGGSVLQAFLSSWDVHEKGKRFRRQSMYTARSQTAVRLSVIPMEDAVETILLRGPHADPDRHGAGAAP
eukprot:jgi/Mesvir1/4785/Mv11085-RA.1